MGYVTGFWKWIKLDWYNYISYINKIIPLFKEKEIQSIEIIFYIIFILLFEYRLKKKS